ncbi:MAG: CoB--CoM heterodisulfide reductase iron-sulfur subunit A family protein [Candidatus Lokiarchaeota archaeon]
MNGSVLVIGGGIAGIQTSLDLTELGFKVYLVERNPSIGGRMAQLDKTFPTNDCSLCILAPKMVEVYRNPNIELMTYHEVKDVSGVAGDFTANIIKKPRYIDETKCKGCGDCASKCPKIEVPNLFDMNLGKRKSAYIPFPQAVPPVYLIDPEICLKLTKGVCGVCAKVCQAEAIDYEQKEQEIQINVGAIVVATGFDMPTEQLSSRWGYKYDNVVSALEYERILCASGPFGGHVLRPSDHTEPERIAFIQCAGSRDLHEGVSYCSSVCCMYTAKEAIITSEHSDKSKCFVFRHDIRAFGKNFYEFTQRAQKEYGVKYYQTKISKINEISETKNLMIHYENLKTGEFENFEADLVVLASPLVPSSGSQRLSEILGIEIDEYKFFKEHDYFNKSKATKEGMYLCGFCQGPMDIPETVADSSGVAGQVAAFLHSVKFEQTEEKEITPELDIKDDDIPRIGVLICHCGINIGKYVQVPLLAEYVRALPNVVHCEDNLYSCSSDSQARIKELIINHKLNRFIVASCTPRTHESLFQETCEEAGLNKYLFEMVNIRDQCSWVHMDDIEAATQKAKDLIRMAVAKARLLKPLKEEVLKITPTALVVGGGIAGMSAALNIAEQGFKTYIVEKEARLGGNLNHLNELYPIEESAFDFLLRTIEKVNQNQNIQTFLSAKVKKVKGYVGNYVVSVEDSKNKVQDLSIGTIIVATGGKEYKPKDLFQYKKENENVITQLELEQLLKEKGTTWLNGINRIMTILCVNARQNEGITYCSNICCCNSIKNVGLLKKLKPELELIVLYRDLQMAKKRYEDYYRERRKDAIFLRYDLDNLPIVKQKQKSPEKYEIKLYDTNLQDFLEFETDMIVLSTPIVPSDNLMDLAKMLKVPLDSHGFFLEAHVKLRPLDFATDGIFLCGCAQWPKNVQDSISQANGAAGRACRFLSVQEIKTSGIVAEVNPINCIGCGKCQSVCAYNAIDILDSVKEFEDVSLTVKKSFINSALCKGCGTCAATCPNGAISIKKYDFDQISAMIDSFLLET